MNAATATPSTSLQGQIITDMRVVLRDKKLFKIFLFLQMLYQNMYLS